MNETQDSGRFIWYDLMTTDTAAAVPFYKDVVGWNTQEFEGGAKPYTMWTGSQGPLGGVMELPQEAAKMGAPPHWMANVTVADVDATLAKVKELGGRVYHGPENIPNIGRFAVIADPQGATLSVFQPASEMKSHDITQPGEIAWNELATSDAEAAMGFYGAVFGWQLIDTMDLGPMGKYLVCGKNGQTVVGIFNKQPTMPVSCWIYYIHVADLDAAVARAKAHGARLINGPMDVPSGDRIAQFIDPQGAMFALHATVSKA